MLLWTIAELMHLTRDELCDLAARIILKLPELEAGTVARSNALASLDNIRRVMALRDLHPSADRRSRATPLPISRQGRARHETSCDG
jgi:hypothetical protein